MTLPFLRARAVLLCLCVGACAGLRTVPAPAVWPLRADTLEANGHDLDCDLLHLSLDVTIDFEARRIYGTCTSWVRGLRGEVHSLRFHAQDIDVRGVRDAEGRELDFELEGPWIRVQLAEPLARGAEQQIRVAYAAHPQAGMFFVESSKDADGFAPQVWTQGQPQGNRHWFPAWDYPSDRTTYDGRIRVGHDMSVVSNGVLVDVEVHGGGERTFHWRMKDSLPTYLIAVAAGRWETYEDEWRGVPLRYHVAPGTGEQQARRALGETPLMMAFFSELLDYPYPYAKYDQAVVTDFPLAGMENATITLLADHILGGPGEVADLDGDPRLLVAHELAHQWFGDLVTCLGWSHLWLNEAWASYLELQFERHMTDDDNYHLWLERYREWYLAGGRSTRFPLALDWRTQSSSPERSNHVYDKGPWVLHMLARELGEATFWDASRAYLKRHAHGLVTTSDFARAIFDETGRNVEGFLEQWVLAGGHPVYDVELDLEQSSDPDRGGSLALRVRQAQDFDQLVPLFDVTLDVDLYFTGGRKERHRLRVREEQQVFRFEFEGELVDVVFDARSEILCELALHKPAAMWVHQATLADHPASQWRALGPLREWAEESDPAALALMRLIIDSPQPLLRQRAARLCDFESAPAQRTLMAAAIRDASPIVRREAAHTLLQHALRSQFEPGSQDYQVLLDHLQVETSPAVREQLERLLRIDD
ncbi:MAG: M1 family aminopeptidase [Planctomycetota bacterium]